MKNENPEREQLILQHLPQVQLIARGISNTLPPHFEVDDLVGAGVLGLLDAAEKFDRGRGIQMNTYAEFRVRGAILDSLRVMDWAPRSLREKSKKVQRACKEVERRLGRQATDEEVCDHLGMGAGDFHTLAATVHGLKLDQLRSSSQDEDADYDLPIDDAPAAFRTDPFSLFERSELRDIVAGAIEALPKRLQLVISLCYYDELSMREIADVLGVTPGRVSQMHTEALRLLRTGLSRVAEERKTCATTASVSPKPVDPICIGATTELRVTKLSPTGGTCAWSSSDPAVVSVGRRTGIATSVKGVSAGTATIRCAYTAGAHSVQDSVTVTVLPLTEGITGVILAT